MENRLSQVTNTGVSNWASIKALLAMDMSKPILGHLYVGGADQRPYYQSTIRAAQVFLEHLTPGQKAGLMTRGFFTFKGSQDGWYVIFFDGHSTAFYGVPPPTKLGLMRYGCIYTFEPNKGGIQPAILRGPDLMGQYPDGVRTPAGDLALALLLLGTTDQFVLDKTTIWSLSGVCNGREMVNDIGEDQQLLPVPLDPSPYLIPHIY